MATEVISIPEGSAGANTVPAWYPAMMNGGYGLGGGLGLGGWGGGIGYTAYYGGYPIAIGIAVLGYLAYPKVKEMFKNLFSDNE